MATVTKNSTGGITLAKRRMRDPIPRIINSGDEVILINQEFGIIRRKVEAIHARLNTLENRQEDDDDIEARLEGQEGLSLIERRKVEALTLALDQHKETIQTNNKIIEALQRRIMILEDRYNHLSDKTIRTSEKSKEAIKNSVINAEKIKNVENRINEIELLVGPMAKLSLE